MRSLLLLSSIIGLGCAAPRPQDIDFALADALPDPTFTEAVGVTAQVVTYDTSAILSSAAPQITATSVNTDAAVIASTDAANNQKRDACAAQSAQPSGYGPVPSPDTPSAFTSYSSFVAAATGAPVPSGYTQAFSNLQASNNAYGYLGFSTLQTYDTNACAAKCNAANGCISFNIYFERDPSVAPGGGCQNPSSTTTIKCVLWAGPVTSGNAVNTGQLRGQFQVVIAGSNGYTSNAVASVPGYSPAVYYGNSAINAPYDQNGYNTYLGSAIFQGPFNAELCAAACSQKSDYARAHPPTDGSPIQTCQFFNTYILYVNKPSNVQGQYCAMYAETWGPKFATNDGQYRGNDHYMIQYSFGYSNATNTGTADPLAAVYQARSDILWPANSAQPFCSSILGYTVPVVTASTVVTTTPISTTVNVVSVTSVVATATSTVYSTASTTITSIVNAKRDVTDGSASTSTTVNQDILPTVAAIWTQILNKRDIPTPSVLTKYPADIVKSACSLAVSPASSTSTVLTTSTQTASTSYVAQESDVIVSITSTVIASSTTTVSTVTTTTSQAAVVVPTSFRLVAVSGPYTGQYLTGGPSTQLLSFTANIASGSIFSIDPTTNSLITGGDQTYYSANVGISSYIIVANYQYATSNGGTYLLCHIDSTSLELVCPNGQFNNLYTCNGRLGIVRDGGNYEASCSGSSLVTFRAISA